MAAFGGRVKVKRPSIRRACGLRNRSSSSVSESMPWMATRADISSRISSCPSGPAKVTGGEADCAYEAESAAGVAAGAAATVTAGLARTVPRRKWTIRASSKELMRLRRRDGQEGNPRGLDHSQLEGIQ